MKCPHCSRCFRSQQAFELAERRRAVIEDLRLTAKTAPDKHQRHVTASEHFRQTADLNH